MKKKILILFFVICFLGNVFPVFAASSAPEVASGTCGDNLTWILDVSGKLTISGEGEMENYTYSRHAPWDAHKASIFFVVINKGITSIGDYAFYECESIKHINIPETIHTFGQFAFFSCVSLSEITIPSGVKKIGSGTFSNCTKISEINLPDSVTTIGEQAFATCLFLKSITVDDNNLNYTSEDGVLFDKDKKTLLHYPVARRTHCLFATSRPNYVIPNGVTEIAPYAFWQCYLTGVIIPEGVTTIGKSAFANSRYLLNLTIPKSVYSIEDNAFASCNNLLNVFYSGNENEWTSISVGKNNASLEAAAFFSETESSETIVVATGNYGEAIDWTLNIIGEMTINGEGKVENNYSAEPYESAITKIYISEGITLIDFSITDLQNLQQIFVPESLAEIRNFPQTAYGLKYVDVADNNPNYCDDNGILFNRDKTELICYPASRSGEEYTIPESVEKLGYPGFCGCSNLKILNIPKSVKSKEERTLYLCYSLTDINVDGENEIFASVDGVLFDKKLTTLIQYPISNKSSSYRIPEGVEKIEYAAFRDNINLESVYFPDSVITIGDDAFSGCSDLKNISLPSAITEINDSTFMNCSSIESIVVPDKVTYIGSHAFLGCLSLKDITLPKSILTIKSYAFGSYGSLENVYYIGSEEEWKNISIGSSSNSVLENATFHYCYGIPVDVSWSYATDSGYHNENNTKLGFMRYLFHAEFDGHLTKSGIKFIKGRDSDEQVGEIISSEKSQTFYGDIINIPEGATGTYFAKGFVTINGITYWSSPLGCSPNFVNELKK